MVKIEEVNRLIENAIAAATNPHAKRMLEMAFNEKNMKEKARLLENASVAAQNKHAITRIATARREIGRDSCSLKASNMEKCVPAMIRHERDANPGMDQSEVVKRAIDKCRARFGADAIFLPNQPLAMEGVLQYTDGGKLKRAEDLRANIGRVIPIIDEHPPKNNGKDGLINGEEQIWGLAIIKACPRNPKGICYDQLLKNGAPKKLGRSGGYQYTGNDEKGIYNGQYYSEVQKGYWLDHIALTSNMREDQARVVAGDAYHLSGQRTVAADTIDSALDRGKIDFNAVGYDALDLKLDARTKAIADRIRQQSPDPNEEDVLAWAMIARHNEQYFENKNLVENPMSAVNSDAGAFGEGPKDEEEMSEEEKKKEEGDSASMTKSRLIAELERLRAEKRAQDSVNRKVDSLTKQLVDSQNKNKQLAEQNKTLMDSIVQNNVDRLVNVHGFDAEDFNGKTPQYIEGALFAAGKVKGGTITPIITGGDSQDQTGVDSTEDLPYTVGTDAIIIDINNFEYDAKTRSTRRIDK